MPRHRNGRSTKSGKLELSARQQQVLSWLLRGGSEQRVADELGVSFHTVHSHVKVIYASYGVHTRAELLALFVTGD